MLICLLLNQNSAKIEKNTTLVLILSNNYYFSCLKFPICCVYYCILFSLWETKLLSTFFNKIFFFTTADYMKQYKTILLMSALEQWLANVFCRLLANLILTGCPTLVVLCQANIRLVYTCIICFWNNTFFEDEKVMHC